MPGMVITRYIKAHADRGLMDIASLFRHDFIHYLGTLQSWMTLIDADVRNSPASTDVLRQKTDVVGAEIDSTFEYARSRLQPTLTDVAGWDVYHASFRAEFTPKLDSLEENLRQLLAMPEFDPVVRQPLNMAIGDESVDGLLLRPFERLAALMDPKRFDDRVGEALGDQRADAART